MRVYPAKLLRAMSDATVGTAIVMVHLVLADRERARVRPDSPPRTKSLTM
jgi:hypothetical protein